MIQWPDSAVEAVARRRAIIVLGAGSSFHATPVQGAVHPPDWETFLKNAADKLEGKFKKGAKRLIEAGEYLSACEVIKSGVANDWIGIVNEAFGNQRLQYGDLHKYVYSLDLPIVITTNFDKVYDNAATTLSDGTVKIKTYRDHDLALLAQGDSNTRVVLKVHGSIDDIGSMIFTRSDYIKLRTEHALFQQIISALAITNTFIFVGCGMTDPDFVLLLENISALSRGYSSHYCLMPNNKGSALETVYKSCFGLITLRYKFDEKHSELIELLAGLVERTSKRRTEMAESLLW